jgi:FkbM family methyltransferase
MDARYNRETGEVIRRVQTESGTGIDVGAYRGEILRMMVDAPPSGRHYAFEPQVALFRGLVRDFPGVMVFPYALGDASGRASFTLALDAPARSGFRKREYPPGEDRTRETTVDVRRLDDVIPRDAPVRIIRIDVEGGEMLVLRGARETILRARPFIVFEHGLGSAESYGTSPEMSWDLLHGSYGLRLWLMADWLAGRAALSRDEYRAQFWRRQNYMFLAGP